MYNGRRSVHLTKNKTSYKIKVHIEEQGSGREKGNKPRNIQPENKRDKGCVLHKKKCPRVVSWKRERWFGCGTLKSWIITLILRCESEPSLSATPLKCLSGTAARQWGYPNHVSFLALASAAKFHNWTRSNRREHPQRCVGKPADQIILLIRRPQ